MIRIEIDCKIDTRGCSDNSLDGDSNRLYAFLLTPFLNVYLSILGDMIDGPSREAHERVGQVYFHRPTVFIIDCKGR